MRDKREIEDCIVIISGLKDVTDIANQILKFYGDELISTDAIQCVAPAYVQSIVLRGKEHTISYAIYVSGSEYFTIEIFEDTQKCITFHTMKRGCWFYEEAWYKNGGHGTCYAFRNCAYNPNKNPNIIHWHFTIPPHDNVREWHTQEDLDILKFEYGMIKNEK